MTDRLTEWIKSGGHLPEPLRDFHDQKDLFKAIHQFIDVERNEYAKTVNWITGQVYVIDIFLWFMARRGYTLQRTRRRGEYRDLASDVALAKAERDKADMQAMQEEFGKAP